MNKGKRNIQQHADKEVKHLMVLLDKSEASVSQFYRTISMELMPRNIGNPFENKIPTLTI